MGNLSEIDRELISAYLDGALEGSERQQAEQLLARDAEAARWLDQLTQMRVSLKEISAPKSLSSLADRVIAQARTVASEQGLPATHHVFGTKVSPRVAEEPGTQRGGMFLVLGTLAASLLALAIIPSRPPAEPQGLASFAPSEEASTEVPGVETTERGQGGSRLGSEGLIVDTFHPSPNELRDPSRPMALNLLNVLDIQMSPEAWQAGKFDQVLSQLGINGAEDFIAPKDALRVLIENNIPGDVDAGSQEQIAMMYIHCTLSAYEKLDTQVASDKESFVQVKRLMANIGPDGSDKLMQSLELKSRSGANRNYSRMILLDSDQDQLNSIVPKFEPVKVANTPVETALLGDILHRDLQAAAAFGNNGEKDETDAIVIIRKK